MAGRRALAILLLTLLAAGRASAQTAPLLFDRDMTVGAGATISATAGEALARAEDQFVPVRLFDEQGAASRTGNIAYRFFKLTLFDLPQERFIQVANHEIFGHGGRLRERFDGPISYSIDVPPPYGPGGGATSFDFDHEPTAYELLAVNAGGMEADSVSAGVAFRRAMTGHSMAPRDALRYLLFELDTSRYINLTGDGAQEPGQDVADWLDVYNHVATSVGASTLRAHTLRREVVVALANPMVAYAAFGIGRYVWDGDQHVVVPAFRFAGLRYLPMARYRLAPYGTEVSIVNGFAGDVRYSEVTLRVGRSPLSTPWSVDAITDGIAEWRGWSLGGGGSVWRQPALEGHPLEIDPTASHVGVELRGTAQRPLIPVWFGSGRATVIVDVAGKTRGFVPGEPLDSGLVVRAGVGLPL